MYRTFGLWGSRYGLSALLAPEGDGGGGGGDDAVKKANFERDSATAKAQKLQEELDALKKSLPSEDERKRGETEVQKLTDEMIKAVDDAAAHKEKEILSQ